ncbi:hypothetical protein OGAPHI_002891 [Ogataea philodendri]|uniref:Uncharacterized protein n=1 Tax=Ogataea philodendri TaxID=1378263 RepID=A0A9P8P9G5_9ASCO|nr:uncharacterized protein OGAPHI_002891 [Ogataea philodendri]KAH3667242.1 hypothetical protein OGAPHI_002891 [Ogataea philodendri]
MFSAGKHIFGIEQRLHNQHRNLKFVQIPCIVSRRNNFIDNFHALVFRESLLGMFKSSRNVPSRLNKSMSLVTIATISFKETGCTELRTIVASLNRSVAS